MSDEVWAIIGGLATCVGMGIGAMLINWWEQRAWERRRRATRP